MSVLDQTLRRGGEQAARIDANNVTRRAALRALPAILERRFDPAAAGDLQTVIELRVPASAGGPEYRFRLQVAGGRLRAGRGAAPDAVCWISASLADMIRMAAGAATMWELRAAKRIDLGGEPFTALRVPRLLGL